MAGGGTGFMPAGGAVAGAGEARGIGERLGEQRSVAVLLLPPRGQVPQRLAEDAAGEMGLGVEQAEARLAHQFGSRMAMENRAALRIGYVAAQEENLPVAAQLVEQGARAASFELVAA